MQEPLSPSISESYDYCRGVARRSAGNFYRGMCLTPRDKRAALLTLYAWMRRADDLADGHDGRRGESEVAEARGQLDALERDTLAAMDPAAALPQGPMWPALRDSARRFSLGAEHFRTMIEAQRGDLQPVCIQTFDNLYGYCYGVASVVGLLCVQVWGDDGHPGVKTLAEYRGVAMQLTNVLRDLGEDARRGRTYLPAEDLERFAYTEKDLRAGVVNDSYRRLMRFQVERARSHYEMSGSLERHLSADCRATSWAMMRTYRALLQKVHDQPEAVLRRRVRLSRLTKLLIVGGAMMKRRY